MSSQKTPTMAISQQQQAQVDRQQQQPGKQAAKPRKRKARQQQQSQVVGEQQPAPIGANKQLQPAAPTQIGVSAPTPKGQEQRKSIDNAQLTAANKQTGNCAHVVPSERTTIKNKIQPQQTTTTTTTTTNNSNQVPTLVKAAAVMVEELPKVNGNQKNLVPHQQQRQPVVIDKHQQIANEEADDIDAGIELDGSSNSGSSVKDMSEDQMKSASVSPVMQANSVSVNSNGVAAVGVVISSKQEQSASASIEVAPIEQPRSAANPSVLKKVSATKQQLAANQQVIDADEQLLQQKLESRKLLLERKQQKDVSVGDQTPPANQVTGDKSQNSGANRPKAQNNASNGQQAAQQGETGNCSASVVPSSGAVDVSGKQSTGSTNNPIRPRRFSSQSSQELLEATVCKVCEQHVYQMERMLAEKSIYHKRCFRCFQCKIQLRVDNYSSHEGQVYCKAHHRQIFQPQVKLDNEDDVDIVAKSTSQKVDDYLLHRGRLSEHSFSFLQPKPEGIRKRQMIICENEPAELPKDVVRSDTKLDDGIEQLNLNLGNILEKFERRTASNGEESQPSSAGIVIEKPSFNIKQTLKAFESRLANPGKQDDANKEVAQIERPVVKRLTNLKGFLNRQASQEGDELANNGPQSAPVRPLAVRRSESLMMRLKKYESRIAGEEVEEDESDDESSNNDTAESPESKSAETVVDGDQSKRRTSRKKSTDGGGSTTRVVAKLSSIDLSSLKSQWENGDINNRDDNNDGDNVVGYSTGDNSGNSPLAEKYEELGRIRQQLASKKLGKSGPVSKIYENAIREAQLQQRQQQASSRRDSSDLLALNGFSTTDMQQQLLSRSHANNNNNNNSTTDNNNSSTKAQNGLESGNDDRTPTTPNKDHFQLNLANKANKLKEKFELGLINNSSRDDSDLSDGDETPAMTKLEQIRQEKMEDLSVFTDGEIKAREARSLFQQIDRRISAANGNRQQQTPVINSRSLASIGASMRSKLTNQMKVNGTGATSSSSSSSSSSKQTPAQQIEPQQPIRLTNNVRT